MEPVSLIVTAIALGAAAGLQATSEQTIKDAYSALKALIQRKFAAVDLTAVEKKPESKAKQDSLAEDLTDAGAGADSEVIAQAAQVIDAAEKNQPLAAAIGVDLAKVKAASLKIKEVYASGSAVRAREVEVTGDIEISNVHAGVNRPNA